MTSSEPKEYNPRPYFECPQCFDCAHYHFFDFGRVTDELGAMHVLDPLVDLNHMSLGACYHLAKAVGGYDITCKDFSQSSVYQGRGNPS